MVLVVPALVACQRSQRRLVLIGANEKVRALIEMAHLTRLLPAFADIEQATESLA